MDEIVSKSLLRRQDVRSVTAGLGVLVTLGLYATLSHEADSFSARALDRTHAATVRELNQEIADLRKTLVDSAGPQSSGTPSAYEKMIFHRAATGGLITVEDSALSSAPVAAGNNGSLPLFDSIPGESFVYSQLKTDTSEILSHSEGEIPNASVLSSSTRVDGTNLNLDTKISLGEARSFANWATLACLGFWIFLTATAHRITMKRRRDRAQLEEWARQSSLRPADRPRLTSHHERAIEATVNSAIRLSDWQEFRSKLAEFLAHLGAGERVVIAKLHFSCRANATDLSFGLAQELALAAEYIQCLHGPQTLIYAFRATGPDSLLYATFSPLRHLVDEGVLHPGEFQVTNLVIGERSRYPSEETLLQRLELNHVPDFKPAAENINSIYKEHLFVKEGFPFPKTTAYSLAQALYIEGELLHAGTAYSPLLNLPNRAENQAPGRAARKNRRPRRHLGRSPTLPPLKARELEN